MDTETIQKKYYDPLRGRIVSLAMEIKDTSMLLQDILTRDSWTFDELYRYSARGTDQEELCKRLYGLKCEGMVELTFDGNNNISHINRVGST